jgi:phosphopantothenoylcysteine decarboxylase/phosphopantothenate--cysteine ligase
MTLASLRIVLGISGGIAAYKSAELVRRLKEAGAEVRVVMTDASQSFITPLTLQAVSGEPVHTSLLDPAAEAAMGHIELARWADLILIAPASADVMARVAAGMANDLLTTLCLAARCPLAIAPAMNQAMWKAPATQENLATLARRGVRIWGPAEGNQACGDTGPGRMLEPLELLGRVETHRNEQASDGKGVLAGRKVVITAGPTREALDPVRFITNHSSGKMGFALAEAARDAGAQVVLIAGPVQLPTPSGVSRLDVVSAQDMLAASLEHTATADIFIAAAAVADYRAASIADHKIKKTAGQDGLTLELVRNPDIVATVASGTPRPFVVGFAAETRDTEHYARDKLLRKNLDMIIANDVSQPGIGFNSDDNAVIALWDSGETSFPAMHKRQLARQLTALIATRLSQKS